MNIATQVTTLYLKTNVMLLKLRGYIGNDYDAQKEKLLWTHTMSHTDDCCDFSSN